MIAPGQDILAAVAPPGNAGRDFNLYSGTSMSSPHVAGLFALLKQANPDWTAAMAKSALMTTARQGVLDNNRTSAADPFDMGAGHVNPGSAVKKGSSFQPGLAYDAGILDYMGFMCDNNSNLVIEASEIAAARLRPGEVAEIKARLAKMGSAVVPGTAAEFAQFIKEEVPRWAGVVKKSGAKVD